MQNSRILVLDGAMGTLIQQAGITSGCNDYLCITHPEIITGIHRQYIEAGADIISTNSFNSNALSLGEYGLQDKAYQIAHAAATLARSVAGDKKVAGSVGPTSVSLTMGGASFDHLAQSYAQQMRGLIDAGVDIILCETFFDTLNAKAAIFALRNILNLRDFPLMMSGTVEPNGRTLSGQSVEAFYESIKHGRPMSVGLNCGFGARQLQPYIQRLAAVATCGVSAHPNAGLPNIMGGYDESAQQMAQIMEEQYLQKGLLNIVGGCCGTTPDHTRALRAMVDQYQPRVAPSDNHITTLSGLEPLYITRENNFVNVGERSNVAGSAKFARLVRQGEWDQAVAVAREQVQAGAQVVDVCMDAPMIDAPQAMVTFLKLLACEGEMAPVAVMIDSSDWNTLHAGLQTQQGKPIVNSISLKQGEAEFLHHARLINDYGAAAVVMLFDEKGQADSFERKIEVASRAYKLLTDNGFAPENIVFDPNVLAIATGMSEHDHYGVDFIEAVRWIKAHCPHAKVSGGVSNLSFSFRGNNAVREAMHSVFLFHAIAAGMDMGIVNPSLLQIYDHIPDDLRTAAQQVVLCGDNRAAAADFLLSYNQKSENPLLATSAPTQILPPAERLAQALVKGNVLDLQTDVAACMEQYGTALEVINQILMPAMATVGELFGAGKMFLPQVVKSARVMKQIVSMMPTPDITTSTAAPRPVVIATVKGDVHDIGKNIVAIVLQCNGYQVVDLGVMVEPEVIAAAAERENPVAVVLSGLITPSLEQMSAVATLFQSRGLKIPIAIGGATTSPLHTAVKIAPHYPAGLVAHSTDASACAMLIDKIANDASFPDNYRQKQNALREKYQRQNIKPQTLEYARQHAKKQPLHKKNVTLTGQQLLMDYNLTRLIKRIDWNFFFAQWDLGGRYPAIFDHPTKGEPARKLYDDAQEMLKELKASARAVYAIVPAHAVQENIIVGDCHCCQLTLKTGRNLTTNFISLADYVAPSDDHIALFALTVENQSHYTDEYHQILSQILCDRLASAFSDELSDIVAQQLGTERVKQVGIGYAIVADHSLKRDIFDYLDVTAELGIFLSETYSMRPTSSICGLMI